jgi:alkaline phosphatase D
VGQADIDQPRSAERRLAGYQAWYEHMPIRLDPPDDFGELEVHRGFAFGSLASLFAIETRQRADVPACRTDGTLVSDDGPLCEDTEDESRTNLGEVQETWLHEALAASSTRWNILANPLMLAGLNTGTAESPSYSRDAWVGYPAARRRLLQAITENEVSNPVAVTGDWHASFVLDVKPDDDPEAETVLPEFLASSISTVLFADDYSEANPHMRYFVGEHGYGLVTVTPEDLRCEFHYIEDEWDPDSPLSHVDTWVVRDGEREAQAL